ncbi:replication initiator protein A [Tautonia plasticadhaerens]|uniref:Replication initiator protein A n=1 Tax=Tautonia plasticadhaerens TaxID=2527974 RepID=A0A518HET5_9BACT|nr:replication initiator protein A [Tautonia plasticadhaerens]QDV39342.1 Replication initiator protein A [Tautonia plasticadhaerens]
MGAQIAMDELVDSLFPDIPPTELQTISGRDEMNLAEFPITLLSDRAPKGQKAIKFQDEVFDERRGKLITRKVVIEGSEEYGLPTAVDDEVILALLQIAKQTNDFGSREVLFTRLQLIQMLGWPNDGRNYRRIVLSLQRIASITLHYENAWWDKRRRAWTTRTFHIIDNVEINDSRSAQQELFPSFSRIVWNEVVFDSFQAGFLKGLDYALCVRMKLSTSKRIYRFLDKRFYHRPDWTFELKDFAYEHVGLSRRYEGNAHIVRKLQPALDELTGLGFLEPLPDSERYLRDGKDWKIRLVRKQLDPGRAKAPAKEPPSPLVAELVVRGVTEVTAAELVRSHLAEAVTEKLEVFDWMVANGDRRLQRSPAGYLVDSIRKRYSPPKGFVSKAERDRREAEERERARCEAEERERKRLEQARLAAERSKVAAYWEGLGPVERAALESEALEQADAALAESLLTSCGTPLESMARRLIREAHIRRLLGLPAAEAG